MSLRVRLYQILLIATIGGSFTSLSAFAQQTRGKSSDITVGAILDKPFYFNGDQVNISLLLYSTNSDIDSKRILFYQELVGPDSVVISKEVVRSSKGLVKSSVSLPSWAASGQYHIKYSLLNGALVSHIAIDVLTSTGKQVSSREKYDLYPNWGTLVRGKSNHVFYTGSGIEKSIGWLLTDENDTLKQFLIERNVGEFEIGVQSETQIVFLDNYGNRYDLPISESSEEAKNGTSGTELTKPYENKIDLSFSRAQLAKRDSMSLTIDSEEQLEYLSILIRKKPNLSTDLIDVKSIRNYLQEDYRLTGEKRFGISDFRTGVTHYSNLQVLDDDIQEYLYAEMNDILVRENPERSGEIDKILLYSMEAREVFFAPKRGDKFLLPIHRPYSTQNLIGNNTIAAFGFDLDRNLIGQLSFSIDQNYGFQIEPQNEEEEVGQNDPVLAELITRNEQKRKANEAFGRTTVSSSSLYDLIKNSPREVTHKIHPKEYEGFSTILDLFKNIVPHVKLKGKPGQEIVTISENETWAKLNGEALMLIDGYPTYEYNLLGQLTPQQIDYIEIINDPDLMRSYDALGVGGILLLHLKPGTENPVLENNDAFVEASGIKLNTEFEARILIPESNEPYFDDVLHFRAFEKVISADDLKVNFTSSDETGVFEIIVSGINKDGIWLHGYSTFTVGSE